MNQPSQNFNPEENNSNFTPPASQPFSNPFTGDVKGEFNSNFGTNTNAVSQIFKEGGFVGDNRKKIMIGVLAAVLLGGAAYFLLSSDGTTSDMEMAETEEAAPVDEAAGEPEEAPAEEAATAEATTAAEAPASEKTPAQPAVSGAIALGAPANGATREYDEISQGAEFTWQGPSDVTVVFARDQAMQKVERKTKVNGNSYQFLNPYPGTWYWRVETANGEASEVRSFTVNPPVRRALSFAQPASGGALAGSGGVVSWQGDTHVAYYRVEFSSSEQWGSPSYVFASAGKQVSINGVSPGSYFMRLGGFSEVSGQWEYSQPIKVTVQ